MRQRCWNERVYWAGTLIGVAALIGGISVPNVRAGEDVAHKKIGEEAPASREVLVAGKGAIADGKSPARITIDLGKEEVSPQAQLELRVTPVSVSPNERYVLVVSIGDDVTGQGTKRLGSVAFFPPPRTGEDRTFLFDMAPITAQMRAQDGRRFELLIALVPVNPGQTRVDSSVRVTGARIIG